MSSLFIIKYIKQEIPADGLKEQTLGYTTQQVRGGMPTITFDAQLVGIGYMNEANCSGQGILQSTRYILSYYVKPKTVIIADALNARCTTDNASLARTNADVRQVSFC